MTILLFHNHGKSAIKKKNDRKIKAAKRLERHLFLLQNWKSEKYMGYNKEKLNIAIAKLEKRKISYHQNYFAY